ncbi:uncharacterized protein BDR25DRAFT_366290, partial [Lindgomyces ingoldianus]
YNYCEAFYIPLTSHFHCWQRSSPEPSNSSRSNWIVRSNITRHALDSAFALFKTIVPRIEMPWWIHLACLLLLLGGCGCISCLTYETGGLYLYGFLDGTKFSPSALAIHLSALWLTVKGNLS